MAKPKTITLHRVTAGALVRDFYTDYHAEQYATALRNHRPLSGIPVTITIRRVPNDALTRLIA